MLNIFTEIYIDKYQSFLFYFVSSLYSYEYIKIFLSLLVSCLLVFVLVLVTFFLSLSFKKDSEQSSEYECGFEPFDQATRHPFDVHFYIVGILFLIFDVEIALLFPWVLSLAWCQLTGFLIMAYFIFLLSVGFYYEWKRGILKWANLVKLQGVQKEEESPRELIFFVFDLDL